MATYLHDKEKERSVTNENGELLDYEHEYSKEMDKVDPSYEEPYIKVYLRHVGRFFNLPESAMNVLLALCSHASLIDDIWAGRRRDSRGRIIDKNEAPKAAKMYLNSALKKDVCSALGISIPTLDRRLKNLCDKQIIKRVDRGTYQLNPYVLARGNWAEILELRTTYDYVNGTMETEMVCRDEETGKPVKVM